jgi:excisionase family DNA binding protein
LGYLNEYGGLVMENQISLFQEKEKLLKAIDVADMLNISRAYAYQLMKRGEIRTVQIGSAKRVRQQDILEFIETSLFPTLEKK